MKKAELVKYFKARFPFENEGGGDWCFTFKDDEQGLLEGYPNLKSLRNAQRSWLSLVGNPRWFIDIKEAVFVDRGSYLFVASSGDVEVINENGPLEVESAGAELQAKAFSWFEKQLQPESVAHKLRIHYDVYDRGGGWQFTHITACIIKGDVERLKGYLAAFEKGDRLNFIPLIKQEFFERAIPLAEKYRSGELVSPVDF
ncbi:hypothetical protein PVT67_16590 [Gallaecimonas kandeliae]|uniref:DUF6990 domain-containing protein n=1 Tax=Gallaecimonas kandeliae TaxID=3029055 RepID=UPI0026492DCF|nr:hypothetical protein [Gallaecimonas kandeliae]WKE65261.1 hypothetical protein PVT67_16590 [Gallaecimonas kandeliae]